MENQDRCLMSDWVKKREEAAYEANPHRKMAFGGNKFKSNLFEEIYKDGANFGRRHTKREILNILNDHSLSMPRCFEQIRDFVNADDGHGVESNES
jgi:hypothetical protein